MKLTLILLALQLGISSTVARGADSFEVQNQALELMNTGDYEGAERILVDSDPVSLRLRLELAQRKGQTRLADQLANKLLLAYQAGSLFTANELAQAAFGAWHLGEWEEANRIYLAAAQKENPALSMYVDWGHLFLEKYNPGEAEDIFSDGIQAGPQEKSFQRWTESDAYVGLAQALADLSKKGRPEALQMAENADPDNLNLLTYQIRLLINEENWEEANKLLQKGFEKNLAYLPFLELDCAVSFFQYETDNYEAKKQKILQINPNNADLYELLGDLSIPNRRLEEAIEFYSTALEKNPRHWRALSSRGINYLRLGEEEKGIQDLERAYENDPYNLWTLNTLRLVDSYKRFDLFETPRFRVRLHQKEAGALKPYVEDLLNRSLSTLEERYQHKVGYKVTFEMFPDHEDFAVRTLGMPGLGALGATIGRIVAMDSPSTRERGKFHWGSTLWHEMAHVVTLSLSKYKVPRWFTEGLSMMEERLGGSGWGDPLSLTFIRYYEEDKLLPLNNLNSGFIRPESPEQIAVSYYQAGWLCEFLAEKYGMDKIRDMLVAYGENLTTDEVFEQVLKATPDQIDEEFKKVLAEALDPYHEVLKRPDEIPEDLEELKLIVQTKPDNYFLNLALGFRLVGKGLYEEAVPYLEHARELFPSNTGEESPYAILQYAYQKLEEQEKLEDLVEEWWARSPLQIDNAGFLAEIKANREREKDQAIAVLEESMFANPLELKNHQELGALYLSRNLPEKAIREFNVALALEPVDRAAAHLQLAQAHFAAGNGENARQQVLMSLEIAPAYIEAQKLLLEIVRK